MTGSSVLPATGAEVLPFVSLLLWSLRGRFSPFTSQFIFLSRNIFRGYICGGGGGSDDGGGGSGSGCLFDFGVVRGFCFGIVLLCFFFHEYFFALSFRCFIDLLPLLLLLLLQLLLPPATESSYCRSAAHPLSDSQIETM